MFRTTLAALLAALVIPHAGAAILRVSASAPWPTHDGSSWPAAFNDTGVAWDGAAPVWKRDAMCGDGRFYPEFCSCGEE